MTELVPGDILIIVDKFISHNKLREITSGSAPRPCKSVFNCCIIDVKAAAALRLETVAAQ